MTNRFSSVFAAEGTAQSPEEPIEALFPLPLSPFERYMALDDSELYPMTFVLIVQLKGNLLRDPFRQAINFALERHPLLKSQICHIWGKGPCWVPVSTPTPQIGWGNSEFPEPSAAGERIDLASGIGVRISVDADPDRADVLFEFHHACTDGLGAVQFIGDLLAHYAELTTRNGDELPELEPVDFDALRARDNYSTSEGERAPKSVSDPYMLGRRLMKLLRRRPVPVASTRGTQGIGTVLEFPAMISRTLDRSEVQQLKAVAARKGVQLNDLYLLETFRTIRDWNRAHGCGRDHQWLRIGMPTSLRTPLHDLMPAANVVSYMFLTRRAGDCDRPEEMLAGIQRQTSQVVNERLGRFIAIGLKYVLKVPGLLWCLLRLNRCFCSAILANVGDIRRQFRVRFPLKHGRCVAGNVTLEALMGSPPIRPNTRLSISLGTYAGSLFINLHCDPLSFTREQAEELADLFVNRLKQASSNQAASNESWDAVPLSKAA